VAFVKYYFLAISGVLLGVVASCFYSGSGVANFGEAFYFYFSHIQYSYSALVGGHGEAPGSPGGFKAVS